MEQKVRSGGVQLFNRSILKKLQVLCIALALALTTMTMSASKALAEQTSLAHDAPQYGQLSAVKFVQVTSGQLGGIALDSTGAVWSWGYNIDGRLGWGKTPTQQNYSGGMRRVDYFNTEGIKVVQVQSGYETNYALDDQGRVYAWGRGNEGQMGNGTTTGTNISPKVVNIPTHVTKIYAGVGNQAHHALAVDTNGDIWGWGYNAGNRIGIEGGGEAPQTTPKKVARPEGVNYVDIAVGDGYSLALTDQGEVYTWGDGYGGVLGTGVTTTQSTPKPITKPSGMGKIVNMSTNFDMVVALDDKHQVWQWGTIYGVTGGTGHGQVTNTPKLLEIDQKEIELYGYTPLPQKVFAGESVSFFVDQFGRPWAWGSGRYHGFGREGGYTVALGQMISKAQQWPKVIGDGDSQVTDSSEKYPRYLSDPNNPSGKTADSFFGYGFNPLHPTIYDEKYMKMDEQGYVLDENGTRLVYQRGNSGGNKDGFYYKLDENNKKTLEVGIPAIDPEDKEWIELAGKEIPYVTQITTSRSAYTLLDNEGNIYKWGYDGSGSIAWGWDYNSKYDQNGSLHTGLYDRYTYEVMFMRGAPTIAPISVNIKDPVKKIYQSEDQSENNTITIDATIPAVYHSDSMNITITAKLKYMKYVVVPYDTSNPDFNLANVDEEAFNKLYANANYQKGSLVDSPIEATDTEQVIQRTIDVNENARIFVMIEDQAYGRVLNTVTSYIATNFYTPTKLHQTGLGRLGDDKYETLYEKTVDGVVKTDSEHDDVETVGIPLDAKGNVIQDPMFGYDEATITALPTLPNDEGLYWNFALDQSNPVVITLNDVKYLEDAYTHPFYYERNMENWVRITYEGVNAATNAPIPDFDMPSELVKKYRDLTRKPPTIQEYDVLGVRVNEGTDLLGLTDGSYSCVPDADMKLTFVYGQPNVSATKSVVDGNKDGLASPGESLTYEISVRNETDYLAKGIAIKDDLASIFEHIEDPSMNTLTITIGEEEHTALVSDLMEGLILDIPAQSEARLSFTVKVLSTLDTTVVTELVNHVVIGEDTITNEIKTAVADMTVTKTVKDANNDGFASPKEELEYIITVQNTGVADASNITVKDDLATVLPYVNEVNDVLVVIDNQGVQSTMPLQSLIDGFTIDVASNHIVTISFVVTVRDDLNPDVTTVIKNTAIVGETTVIHEIPTGQPALSGLKEVVDASLDGYASVNEVLSYRIAITNSGLVTAKDVLVVDDLATLKQYLKTTDGITVTITIDGATTTKTLTDLMAGFTLDIPAGKTAEITFNVTVGDNLDGVKSLKNSVKINDDIITEEILVGKADLKGSKVVVDGNQDNLASPGETLSYIITIENTGDVVAEDVLIQDTLSDLIDYVQNTDAVAVIVVNGQTQTSQTIQNLRDGFRIDIAGKTKVTLSFTLTLKENLNVDTVTEVTNTVKFGDDETTVTIPTGKTDFLSTKTVVDDNGDGYAQPGEWLTYTLATTNKGDVKAEGVVIQDTLSTLIDHIENPNANELNINHNNNVTLSNVEALMNGITFDLEAKDTLVISFKVQVKSSLNIKMVTKLENIASIGDETIVKEIPTGDSDLTNSSKSVKDDNGDGLASPGEKLAYTITIINSGVVDVKDLLVKDDLADLYDYVNMPDNNTVTIINGSDTHTTTVGALRAGFTLDIAGGTTATITFTVTVIADLDTDVVKEIGNTVTLGDVPHTEIIPTGKQKLQSTKEASDANGDGFASPGETISYVITTTNDGDVDAEGIEIQDTLEFLLPHIKAVGANVLTINNGGEVTETTVQALMDGMTFDILAGTTLTLSFEVELLDTLDPNLVTEIKNSALVDKKIVEETYPTGNVDLSDSTKTSVDTNGDGYASPGEQLTYTISVKNTGKVTAKDIVVQDSLSDLLPHIIDPSSNVVTVNNKGIEYTFTVADLMNGLTLDVEGESEVIIVFSVTVKDSLDTSVVTELRNTVTIDGNDIVNIIDTDAVDLTESTKTVTDANGDGFAAPGEVLTYTISLKNTSKVAAKGVFVRDTLFSLKDYIKEDVTNTTVTINHNGTTTAQSLQSLMDGFLIDIDAQSEVILTFEITLIDALDVTKVTKLTNLFTIDGAEVRAEIPTGDSDLSTSSKSVVDSNGDGYASPKEDLIYTIIINNTGLVDATQITVRDELTSLVPHIEDASKSTLTINHNGTITTMTVQNLIDGFELDVPAGSTITLTFTVTLLESLDVETVHVIGNIATLGDTTVETEIETAKGDIVVTKVATDAGNDGFAAPGELITYVIEAINTGEANMENVLIQDTLESLIDYIVDPSERTVVINNDGEITNISLAQLQEGIRVNIKGHATITIAFEVQVDPDLDLETVTQLENVALVGEKTGGKIIPTGVSDLSTSDKVVIDTDGDGFASPKEELTYTITVRNTGKQLAQGVVVQDTLTKVIPHVEDVSNTLVVINNNNKLSSQPLQSLIEGISLDVEGETQVTLTFTVKVLSDLDVSKVPEIMNTVKIADLERDATIETGDSDLSDSTKVVTDENEDGYASLGETLTYEIIVSNTGKVAALDVMVMDDLKGVLPYVNDPRLNQLTIISTNGEDYTNVADLMDGLTVDVAANSETVLRFEVVVRDDLDLSKKPVIANTVTIDETNSTVIIEIQEDDLSSSTKAVSDETNDGYASPGENLDYIITVINTGLVASGEIKIQDSLEDMIDHIDDPTKNIVKVDDGINIIEYTVGQLMDGIMLDVPANSRITLSFSVRVKETLNVNEVPAISNLATIGDVTVTQEVPTGAPDLSGSNKRVTDEDTDGTAAPGETLNYLIQLVNQGKVDAKEIWVQDTLEHVIPYVVDPRSSSITIVSGETTIIKTVNDLMNGFNIDIPANGIVEITFQVTLKNELSLKPGEVIKNVVILDQTTIDVEIPVGEVKLSGDKVVYDANRDGYATPGESIAYEISATNNGTLTASGVLFKDEMVDVLQYTTATKNATASVSINGTVETITLQQLIDGVKYDIPAGQTVTIAFSATVRKDLDVEAVKQIVNIATIGETDKRVVIDTTTDEITSNKEVSDENGDGFASPGEALSYRITFKNEGEAVLNDVLIKDDLASMIDYIKPAPGKVVTLNVNGEYTSMTLNELMSGFTVDIPVQGSVEVTFTVYLLESLDTKTVKSIKNVATIGDKKVTEEIETLNPVFETSKAVVDGNGNNVAERGEVLTYTITAKNTSNSNAYGVLIFDSLKDVLPYIDNPENNKVTINNNGEITEATVGDLIRGITIDILANTTATITFDVRVIDNLVVTPGATIRNTAAVGDNQPTVEIPLPSTPMLPTTGALPSTGLVDDIRRLQKSIIIIGTAFVVISILLRKKEHIA